jgi:hypothetical protein
VIDSSGRKMSEAVGYWPHLIPENETRNVEWVQVEILIRWREHVRASPSLRQWDGKEGPI